MEKNLSIKNFIRILEVQTNLKKNIIIYQQKEKIIFIPKN